MILLILIIGLSIQFNDAVLEEGAVCKINEKSYGRCTLTMACVEIANNIENFITNHTQCSYNFDKELEIVCCPNSTITSNDFNKQTTIPNENETFKQAEIIGKKSNTKKTESNVDLKDARISIQKCKEYQAPVRERLPDVRNVFTGLPEAVYRIKCNQTSTKPFIYKGFFAEALEFPHMVLIGTTAQSHPLLRWFCGGSLISDEYILTAAHCAHSLNGKMSQKADIVLLGDLDISKTTDNAQPLILEVLNFYLHPNYSHSNGYDDIALIQLTQKVNFSRFIRPACLASSLAEYNVNRAIATGWGGTIKYHGSNPSTRLKGVNLKLVPYNTCVNALKPHIDKLLLAENVRNYSQICAGSTTEDKDDTCSGDSGGPLQIYHLDHYNYDCMYSVIGITSIGYACASGVPGVYTRVLYYLDWIENIVWPQN